jgi:hypothetical protein
MKYIRKFTKQERSIEDWCKEFKLKNYEIINDFVNIRGNIFINDYKIDKMPIQFGKVDGYFICVGVKIKNLEGCPIKVGSNYEIIGGYLTSLVGCPEKIIDSFNCNGNRLTSLEGGPKEVGRNYNCMYNNFITLEGSPEKLGGVFDCSGNRIYEVYELFGTLKRYKASMDYNYLRGTDIILKRFEAACLDADISVPESIYGYKYI